MRTNSSRYVARLGCATLAAAFASSQIAYAAPAKAPARVLFKQTLPNGDTATVYASRVAMVVGKKRRTFDVRYLPGNVDIRDRRAVAAALEAPRATLYAPDRVIVVFSPGAAPGRDVVMPPSAGAGPPFAYTNNGAVNAALAGVGASRLYRIAPAANRSRLEAMQSLAASRGAAGGLDLADAYLADIGKATVFQAVERLRGVPGIAYVEPDWAVSPLSQSRATLAAKQLAAADGRARQMSPAGVDPSVPKNYAVAASAQPMLAATGVDAIAAYDLIRRHFGQLPGQGEIVTSVSIGDISDSTAFSNFKDPCQLAATRVGPTTHLIGKQHYIDWPAMPLVPVYTADPSGQLSGETEVCNTPDYQDEEIGLGLSMMAPLPHTMQRGGAVGQAYTDLLGIAPGAQYRVVVPLTQYLSNVVAALVAAAAQSPAPNVITASIGFGYDAYGFPGRFIDEDPVVQAAVRTIVNAQNIVVSLAANDGTGDITNAAIGPTGGSAATDLAHSAADETSLADIAYSTAPSSVLDDGAIDVGGATTDDIFAVNPNDPRNAARTDVASVAETRYTGFTSFSSGFGSRVNVSAPSDNLLALLHTYGGAYNTVDVSLEGGTSASAPEVAAAAAVALQAARLTGHPYAKATDVREALVQTGTAVAAIPQEDRRVHIGPRIDLARLVASAIARTGKTVVPAIAHVSIMQRGSGHFDNVDEGGVYGTSLDSMFTTDTDPDNIDIEGPFDTIAGRMSGLGMDEYITIAPDWEGIPGAANYRLTVANGSRSATIATTSSARLLPAQLLAAAGLAKVSRSSRTVTLVYAAREGTRTLASTKFRMTFGPSVSYSERVFAPDVDPVVTGPTMRVAYDLRGLPQGTLANAELVVSEPGRINPVTGGIYRPAYSKALSASRGTLQIPVSKLQGDGIYGVGIVLNTVTGMLSDFAYARVQNTASSERPAAPTFVSKPGITTAPAHYLEIPFGGRVRIAYDVSHVPNATGAILEVSAAGPTIYGNENPINNPNGSIVDDNGDDTGSIFSRSIGGTKGTLSLTAAQLHLVASLGSVVRVIPVAGSRAAGEASDVSYVKEDGVVPPDGGTLEGGFSIDTSGNEGMFASNLPRADGTWDSAIYAFDQKTMTAGAPIASKSGGYDWYDLAYNGIYAPATGLFRKEPNYENAPVGFVAPKPKRPTFRSIADLAGDDSVSPWTPPLAHAASDIIGAGTNSTAGSAAFLVHDNAYIDNTGLAAFVSNVGANTFGKAIHLAKLIPSFGWQYAAFDYDSSTNYGYEFNNVSFFGQLSTPIVRVNFTKGRASLFGNDPCGGAIDFVIDPSLHVGFLSGSALGCSPDNMLQLIDLTAKTYSPTSSPAENGDITFVRVANDPVHHLFFAQAPISPDIGYNNNSLSSIYVLNSSGRQVESFEKFNFSIDFDRAHNFRVNGHTRRGFVWGPGESQIQPFSY